MWKPQCLMTWGQNSHSTISYWLHKSNLLVQEGATKGWGSLGAILEASHHRRRGPEVEGFWYQRPLAAITLLQMWWLKIYTFVLRVLEVRSLKSPSLGCDRHVGRSALPVKALGQNLFLCLFQLLELQSSHFLAHSPLSIFKASSIAFALVVTWSSPFCC